MPRPFLCLGLTSGAGYGAPRFTVVSPVSCYALPLRPSVIPSAMISNCLCLYRDRTFFNFTTSNLFPTHFDANWIVWRRDASGIAAIKRGYCASCWRFILSAGVWMTRFEVNQSKAFELCVSHTLRDQVVHRQNCSSLYCNIRTGT
jgi:hypothetical protein